MSFNMTICNFRPVCTMDIVSILEKISFTISMHLTNIFSVILALVSTIIGIGVTPTLLKVQSAQAYKWNAPLVQVAASGSKVYVVWDSNKTSALKEILFRASSDNGKTFTDKINLSHSPK